MTDPRLVNASRVDDDAQYETGLRPRTARATTSGRPRVCENLHVSITGGASARTKRSITCCSTARPGLGKTTLAYVIGNELGVAVRATSGPALEKTGDLAGILTSLKEREVLFIDEVHRMSPVIEEFLYPAMEDFEIDIVLGQGPGARSVKMAVPPFTLIGATTRAGLLTSPLRARFGIVHRLDFYELTDLRRIVARSAGILGVEIADEAPTRSRAGRAARRASPTACCGACATSRRSGPTAASRPRCATPRCELLEVDAHGFDESDRRLLRTIIDKFAGGPVGPREPGGGHRRGDATRSKTSTSRS